MIEGDFESKAAFYAHNQKLVGELETLEAKSRRRDIIVDENVLYDFYDKKLPDDICSGPTLDKWLRQCSYEAKTLFLSTADLMRDDATLVSESSFPDYLEMNGSRFPIEYHFDPSNHCDGVTLITPIVGLSAINPQRCEWLIHGLLREKIIALIKSLPKQLRKNFVPAPNFADACVEILVPSDDSICAAVANQLKKMTGVQIPYDAWNMGNLSDHLLMNFRVVNPDGSVVEEGRDLQTIKNNLGASSETDTEYTADVVENDIDYGYDDVTVSVLDDMDETVELNIQGITIKAYPALVKRGKKVNLRALENKQVAAEETRKALRQLFINAVPEQVKHLGNTIPGLQNLCLKYTDFGRCDDLKQEIVNKTIDDVFLQGSIQTEKEFNRQLEKGRSELYENAKRWVALLSTILDGYRAIKKIMKKPLLTQLDMVSDVQLQLSHLFPENFITNIDQQWLQQYPRYLTAIKKRFDKAQSNALRDRQLRIGFSKLWDEYFKRYESLVKQHIDSDELNHYRWMLEEYRVSLFAQELKTKFPISEKRLKKYWNDLSGI